MPMPVEFDCRDCGAHVYSFGHDVPPEPPLCASCEFILTIPDPDERTRLRARLAAWGED